MASGKNYKINSQTITSLTSSPYNAKYSFINSKSGPEFQSAFSNYTYLSYYVITDELWEKTSPTTFACYYFDTDNDNMLDNGEQLGFTFTGTKFNSNGTNTNISTVIVENFHIENTENSYHYLLLSLADIETATVYFNFYDNNGDNANTNTVNVPDPSTNLGYIRPK